MVREMNPQGQGCLRQTWAECSSVPAGPVQCVQQPHVQPQDQGGRPGPAQAQPGGPHAAAEEAGAEARHCLDPQADTR